MNATLAGTVKEMNRIRFIYIFCIGDMLLIFGIGYLAFFAFPYPDLPPEERAIHRLHELVSKWCVSGGVVLIEVSIVGGIIKALGKRLATPLRKTLIGISFLILGGLYGSYLVLKLSNPTPPEMQWVAQVFVSVTLLLAGLGLLIIVTVRKILANKALRRTSR
jgi:uncharacterized protein YhhL (DUF1145 family)